MVHLFHHLYGVDAPGLASYTSCARHTAILVDNANFSYPVYLTTPLRLLPLKFCDAFRISTVTAAGTVTESSTIIIRDLRSFEIRFESDVPIRIRFERDVPIRKFRISGTCRVPSYHKLRLLTVQQKHQPLRRL